MPTRNELLYLCGLQDTTACRRPILVEVPTPVLHVILYQPEIPPNTGNIIRLCANSGATLHLIEPLGFELDNARVKRAGLDYHELARVRRHRDWATFLELFCAQQSGGRIWAFSTHGTRRYDTVTYRPGDAMMFGPESRGLPAEVMSEAARTTGSEATLRLPMMPSNRSLNLSNAVAIGLYEALRQTSFQGLT